MKGLSLCCISLSLSFAALAQRSIKVFDVHLHGDADPAAQVAALEKAGVYSGALSTNWAGQAAYAKAGKIQWRFGLMLPCPNGKVPYSGQACFEDGKDWPPVDWVEAQIRAGRIRFLGEVLTTYYGISSSDTLMDPYYALAQQYGLPVGLHAGGAGPGHGSPNFRPELGNPDLLRPALKRFPRLKVWLMHAGDAYHREAIRLMQDFPHVYADISVLSNPAIVPASRFHVVLKDFLDAGLEDRIMFGSDNGDIHSVIQAVEGAPFLSPDQKEKIYSRNAERFFGPDSTAAAVKEYTLVRKTGQADINRRALLSLNKGKEAADLRLAFEPVRGGDSVYQFMATYKGNSYNGRIMDFHDILVIKTNAHGAVIEAFQYTLEWAEMPRQADLYRAASPGVRLRPGMAVRELGLQRVMPVPGTDSALEDSGTLRF